MEVEEGGNKVRRSQNQGIVCRKPTDRKKKTSTYRYVYKKESYRRKMKSVFNMQVWRERVVKQSANVRSLIDTRQKMKV